MFDYYEDSTAYPLSRKDIDRIVKHAAPYYHSLTYKPSTKCRNMFCYTLRSQEVLMSQVTQNLPIALALLINHGEYVDHD